MRRFLVLASFLVFIGVVAAPAQSYAGLDLSVSFDLFAPPPVAIAPPPLPIYVVPEPPVENYIWLPGHWLYADYGYFWVPGTWAAAPQPGYLWTPGYWGWQENAFAWHEGYWGPHVGFYGGVNYGGGYDGQGFHGGEWHGDRYDVNRSVINVTNITHVTNMSTVSYNGGPGGINRAPNAEEESAAHEHHIEPTADQRSHAEAASRNPAFAAANNHGKPSIAATTRPGDFTHGVVAAKQAGARNPAAAQHNAEVRKNPALAHGAALPRAQTPNAQQGANRSAPVHPQQQAQPVIHPTVVQPHENYQQHEAVQPHEPVQQPHEAVQQHENIQQEPHEASQPHEPAQSHTVGQYHEPDAHPRNQPFHPDVMKDVYPEPAEKPHDEPADEHHPQ